MLKKWLFVLFICFIYLLYHILNYTGHFGYDDMYYAKFAYKLSTANLFINDTDHYAHRWGILAPLSIIYKYLGVNDTSSAIAILPFTFIAIAITAYIFKNKNIETLAIATSIFAFNHWTMFYADKIMPDSLVTLAILIAASTLYQYKFELKNSLKNTLLSAFIFSAALFWGFLCKETVWLSVPIWVCIAAIDAYYKQHLKFWAYTLIIGSIIASIYFTTYAIKTGNPFFRFTAIELNAYFMANCSYSQLPASVLLKRISYEQFLEFIKQGMVMGMMALPLVIFIAIKNKQSALNAKSMYWILVAAIALFSANFNTISLKHYSPMCPDPRHYLFIIPLCAIATANIWYQFLTTKAYKHFFLAISFLLFIIAIWQNYLSMYYLYLPLFAVILTRYFLPIQNKLSKGLIPAFLLVLFAQKTTMFLPSSYSIQYKNQKLFVWDVLKSKPQNITVITNEVQQRFCEYYYGFNTKNHRYITYQDVKNGYEPENETEVYLLVAGLSQYLAGSDWNGYPEYIKTPPLSLEKVYEDDKGILLYKVNNFNDLIAFSK